MFVVLHGQTEWNRDGRLQGRSDSALTAFGQEQSRKAASTVRALAGFAPLRIVSSTLGRTRATAAILASALEVAAPLFDDRLRELALGEWEGLTREEIAARWPERIAGATRETMYFHAPGGESYVSIAARIGSWFGGERESDDLVVVTHGIAGRVLRGLYLGLGEDDALRLPIRRDGVVRLQAGTEAMF